MAITWVSTKPALGGHPATQGESGTTYTQKYHVTYNKENRDSSGNDVQLLEASALFAPGIPRYGDSFKLNNAAFVNSISANVLSSQSNQIPNQVIVTVTFSTIANDKKDEEEDPLKKAPDVAWTTHFEREVIDNARILKIKDNVILQEAGKGGKLQQINNFAIPITNSVGVPFTPAPEIDVPYMKVSIVQNLGVFDVGQANSMIQTVNVKSFQLDGYTITEGQGLLLDRSATIEYQGKISYRVVTTEILIKSDHELSIKDNGKTAYFGEKPSNKFKGGKQADIDHITFNGKEVDDAQLLDGKGNAVADGGKAVFLNWGIFAVSDFNQLQLPAQRL